MSKGYIKQYRSTLESRVFQHKDPYMQKIWDFILLSASYKDREVVIGAETVRLTRGQFVTGRIKGAEICGCTTEKFRYCLNVLEKYQMINQIKHRKYTIIEVVNYNKYQDFTTEFATALTTETTPQLSAEHTTTAPQTIIAKEYINNSCIDAPARAHAREGGCEDDEDESKRRISSLREMLREKNAAYRAEHPEAWHEDELAGTFVEAGKEGPEAWEL